MNELPTFSEWRKGQPRRHVPKKPSVKNPSIDLFVKSVDNLKRDMDALDAVEKKEKAKAKVQKPFDSFKDYKKKRDTDEKKVKDKDREEADDQDRPDGDVLDEPDDNRPRKRVRLLPDREVPISPQRTRGKPRRQGNPGAEPMED